MILINSASIIAEKKGEREEVGPGVIREKQQITLISFAFSGRLRIQCIFIL